MRALDILILRYQKPQVLAKLPIRGHGLIVPLTWVCRLSAHNPYWADREHCLWGIIVFRALHIHFFG